MCFNIIIFFAANPHDIISPLFGMYYWIGLIFSISCIGSLFIFKKFYAKLSKYYSFKLILGVCQLLLYVGFYLVHGLNNNNYHWCDYFPFQLCSALNLTSGVLLIMPIKGVFNITFPLIGPVLLAFFFPNSSKWVFGPQHFLYWNYYLIHTIIIFSYLYLYLYGHVQYNKMYIKKSILYITMFGAGVFIFNTLFGTNYLFIGNQGYTASIGKHTLDTSVWAPILRFVFMFVLGVSLLFLTYIFIIKTLLPFYIDRGAEVNPLYENKKKLMQKIYNFFKSRKFKSTIIL